MVSGTFSRSATKRIRDGIDHPKGFRTALISAAVTGKIDVQGGRMILLAVAAGRCYKVSENIHNYRGIVTCRSKVTRRLLSERSV